MLLLLKHNILLKLLKQSICNLEKFMAYLDKHISEYVSPTSSFYRLSGGGSPQGRTVLKPCLEISLCSSPVCFLPQYIASNDPFLNASGSFHFLLIKMIPQLTVCLLSQPGCYYPQVNLRIRLTILG